MAAFGRACRSFCVNRPLLSNMPIDRFGRVPRIGHTAAFRVEQPPERLLLKLSDGPLLAES